MKPSKRTRTTLILALACALAASSVAACAKSHPRELRFETTTVRTYEDGATDTVRTTGAATTEWERRVTTSETGTTETYETTRAGNVDVAPSETWSRDSESTTWVHDSAASAHNMARALEDIRRATLKHDGTDKDGTVTLTGDVAVTCARTLLSGTRPAYGDATTVTLYIDDEERIVHIRVSFAPTTGAVKTCTMRMSMSYEHVERSEVVVPDNVRQGAVEQERLT